MSDMDYSSDREDHSSMDSEDNSDYVIENEPGYEYDGETGWYQTENNVEEEMNGDEIFTEWI